MVQRRTRPPQRREAGPEAGTADTSRSGTSAPGAPLAPDPSEPAGEPGRAPSTSPTPRAATLHGRPLLDSRADMALYLSRPALEGRLDAALARGLNVLLTAPRGGGRTTLLRALLFRRRRTRGAGTIYLRAASATTVPALLRLVRGALLPDEASTPAPAGNGEGAAREADDALALIGSLGDALADSGLGDPAARPLLCLDDVDPRIGNQLFGVLRDEVWSLPVQWIVTACEDDEPVLALPPADAFFEARLAVPPLSPQEAQRLIELRLGHEVRLPEQVGQVTPREALDLARLAPQEWQGAVDARARRDEQVAKLGRPATMLVAAMEELGPVSPSDDRLLARTGWTSSRASQVFRQLLAVGVVAYREVRGNRQGRPARLYELTPLRG